MDFFDRLSRADATFSMFTLTHLVTGVISVCLIYLAIKYMHLLKGKKYEPVVRILFGLSMLLTNVTLFRYQYQNGEPWYMYLPIATCGWAIITGGFALIFKNRILGMLCMFWGFGAVLTLMGPTVTEGPTYYNFYQFFYRHIAIIVAGFYLNRVVGIKIFKKDFWMYFVISLSMGLLGGYLSTYDPEKLNLFYMLRPGIDLGPLAWVYEFNYTLYLVLWIIVASLMAYFYGYLFYEKER